jgi:hypothetical protein
MWDRDRWRAFVTRVIQSGYMEYGEFIDKLRTC